MTLFKAGSGRMSILIMIAEQLWYIDLIQGRKRPDGHPYHDCGAIMIYYKHKYLKKL